MCFQIEKGFELFQELLHALSFHCSQSMNGLEKGGYNHLDSKEIF